MSFLAACLVSWRSPLRRRALYRSLAPQPRAALRDGVSEQNQFLHRRPTEQRQILQRLPSDQHGPLHGGALNANCTGNIRNTDCTGGRRNRAEFCTGCRREQFSRDRKHSEEQRALAHESLGTARFLHDVSSAASNVGHEVLRPTPHLAQDAVSDCFGWHKARRLGIA